MNNLSQEAELNVDKIRIIQALDNVINNCIKFTEEGKIGLETYMLPRKNLLEIKISYTGSGISLEVLPRLFEKFATTTSGDQANKHGTGLGLFISKSIIQAHGGDIFGYNNEDEKGSTFIMRLPIIKATK